MDRSNGAEETPIKLEIPELPLELFAPWNVVVMEFVVHPVPSPPEVSPLPQLELMAFFPKTVN